VRVGVWSPKLSNPTKEQGFCITDDDDDLTVDDKKIQILKVVLSFRHSQEWI